MEFNIKDLSEEDLNRLKWKMLTACRDYEPWADLMMLSGAESPGALFPLDLEEIESINISFVGREGPQESGSIEVL